MFNLTLTDWLLIAFGCYCFVFLLYPFVRRATYRPIRRFFSLHSWSGYTEQHAFKGDLQGRLIDRITRRFPSVTRYKFRVIVYLMTSIGLCIGIIQSCWIWSNPQPGETRYIIAITVFITLLSLTTYLIRSCFRHLWEAFARDVFRNSDLMKHKFDEGKQRLFDDYFYLKQGYIMKFIFNQENFKRIKNNRLNTHEEFWIKPPDVSNPSSMNSLEIMQFLTYDIVRRSKSYEQFVELSSPENIEKYYGIELPTGEDTSELDCDNPNLYLEERARSREGAKPKNKRYADEEGKVKHDDKEEKKYLPGIRDWTLWGPAVKDRFHSDILVAAWNDTRLGEIADFSAEDLFKEFKRHADRFDMQIAQDDLHCIVNKLMTVSPERIAGTGEQADLKEVTESVLTRLVDSTAKFDSYFADVSRSDNLRHFIAFMQLIQFIWSIRHFNRISQTINRYLEPATHLQLVMVPVMVIFSVLGIACYMGHFELTVHPLVMLANMFLVGAIAAFVITCTVPIGMVWCNFVGTGTFRIELNRVNAIHKALEDDLIFYFYNLLAKWLNPVIALLERAQICFGFKPLDIEAKSPFLRIFNSCRILLGKDPIEYLKESGDQDKSTEEIVSSKKGTLRAHGKSQMDYWVYMRNMINYTVITYLVTVNFLLIAWHYHQGTLLTNSYYLDCILAMFGYSLMTFVTWIILQNKFLQGVRSSAALTIISHLLWNVESSQADTEKVTELEKLDHVVQSDKQLEEQLSKLTDNNIKLFFDSRFSAALIVWQLVSMLIGSIAGIPFL